MFSPQKDLDRYVPPETFENPVAKVESEFKEPTSLRSLYKAKNGADEVSTLRHTFNPGSKKQKTGGQEIQNMTLRAPQQVEEEPAQPVKESKWASIYGSASEKITSSIDKNVQNFSNPTPEKGSKKKRDAKGAVKGQKKEKYTIGSAKDDIRGKSERGVGF